MFYVYRIGNVLDDTMYPGVHSVLFWSQTRTISCSGLNLQVHEIEHRTYFMNGISFMEQIHILIDQLAFHCKAEDGRILLSGLSEPSLGCIIQRKAVTFTGKSSSADC